VMRAGTAATIANLEDRIAAIDYQLNDPESQLSPEDEEIFWRDRVRLMKLLVGMRYAQVQRTAF
jgi:predicted sulfurtransferase